MQRIAALTATLMLTGAISVAIAAQKPKTMMAQGKVTAVTGDSLAIMKGSETMTFAVDASTKVLGKGLGTMANEKKAKGEPFTVADGVALDDIVKVTYHDVAGKMHASQVNVVQKSMKSQMK